MYANQAQTRLWACENKKTKTLVETNNPIYQNSPTSIKTSYKLVFSIIGPLVSIHIFRFLICVICTLAETQLQVGTKVSTESLPINHFYSLF